MSLRITPVRQVELGKMRANQHTADAARLRDQISSGIRISRPSDDPRGQELVLDQYAIIGQLETRSEVIDEVRFVLNEAHTQIRQANNYVVQAKDIALQVNQVTAPVEAEAFALEIESILNSLGDIANSRHSGRYLFGGTNLHSPPYGDVTFETQYSGNVRAGSTFVAGAGHIATFYSGQDVFSSGQSGTTLVTGSTGIQGGTGTSTGHGTGQLLVSHTSTTYAGGSGIQPGLSSVSGDTVIGPMGQHTIEIIDTSGTGASGTISLNGGPPTPFTSADTDLMVAGPSGERIYVDTSAIVAGTNASFDLQSDGRMSLNDGASFTDIDFTANQMMKDADGNIRYLDTRGASQTGEADVNLTGNTDIFHQLRTLRDDLKNYSDFSSSEWESKVAGHLGALEQAGDHMLTVIGKQSVDLQHLDTQQERSVDIQVEAEKVLSGLQATDLTDAVLELQEKELQHQFTLATLARAYDSSILDYL